MKAKGLFFSVLVMFVPLVLASCEPPSEGNWYSPGLQMPSSIGVAQPSANNVEIRVDGVQFYANANKDLDGENEVILVLFVARSGGGSRRMISPGEGTYHVRPPQYLDQQGFAMGVNDLRRDEEIFIYLVALDVDQVPEPQRTLVYKGIGYAAEQITEALLLDELSALLLNAFLEVGLDAAEQPDIMGEVYTQLSPEQDWLAGQAFNLVSPNKALAVRISIFQGGEPLPPKSAGELSPQKFICYYYGLINQREYRAAWQLLSPHFIQKHNSTGFGPYQRWWETVERVDVLSTRLEWQEGDRALVWARLRYHSVSGKEETEAMYFELVSTDKIGAGWLIDDTRYR